MKKKAAMELSATVIVTIIVAVVIVALGFFLFFKVISIGESEIEKTITQTKQELQKLQNTDQKFFILDSYQEAKPGKNSIFGVGIFNRVTDTANFKIQVSYKGYVNADGNEEYFDGDNLVDVTVDNSMFTVEKNKGITKLITINIPKDVAKPGNYYFIVNVCSNNVNLGDNDGKCTLPAYNRNYAAGRIEIKI